MVGDINHVILVGRLTRDAELKYTQSGSAVANIGLAVNRRRKNGDQWVDEVNFFDVTLWGRSAEGLSNYLKKGTRIAVDGELRQNRWQQDGQNRSKVEIVASSIQLLGSGNGNGPGNGDVNRGTTAENQSAPSQNYQNNFSNNFSQQPAAPSGNIPDDFDDDIPF